MPVILNIWRGGAIGGGLPVIQEVHMLTSSTLKSPLRMALLAGVIGLGFTTAASAQDYGRPVYSANGPEEITITAPHRHTERSEIGAPIEDVALSRPVRYDDLDL